MILQIDEGDLPKIYRSYKDLLRDLVSEMQN